MITKLLDLDYKRVCDFENNDMRENLEFFTILSFVIEKMIGRLFPTLRKLSNELTDLLFEDFSFQILLFGLSYSFLYPQSLVVEAKTSLTSHSCQEVCFHASRCPIFIISSSFLDPNFSYPSICYIFYSSILKTQRP